LAIELVLYVNPASPASIRARRDLEAFLAVHPSSSRTFVVRDVTRCASELDEDRVLYTPTLVVKGDGPTSWLVGDFQNPETLAAVLHLTRAEDPS
jgi:hypothetical protein